MKKREFKIGDRVYSHEGAKSGDESCFQYLSMEIIEYLIMIE